MATAIPSSVRYQDQAWSGIGIFGSVTLQRTDIGLVHCCGAAHSLSGGQGGARAGVQYLFIVSSNHLEMKSQYLAVGAISDVPSYITW